MTPAFITDRRPSPPDDGIDPRSPAEHALDAADAEIERLRAQVAEARGLVRKLRRYPFTSPGSIVPRADADAAIARWDAEEGQAPRVSDCGFSECRPDCPDCGDPSANDIEF
jgi:hypothetical protein